MTAYQKKITIALLIATFLSAIEGTIISTATPAIVNSLGGLELISWVFAIYLLTSAVTTPIFGKLSDIFGRKKVFLIGVSIFLIGSLLCGIAQTMWQLIFFRALQGVGAGAVVPITFTIIGDIFSFEQRAKIQGLISSVWGIAGLFGPLVGGFLVDFVSWHWIFLINLPFGLISMWMIGKHLEEKVQKEERKKIDYGGALTFTIGMSALLYLLLAGGSAFAWQSGTSYLLLGTAVASLIIFLWIELRHSEPMIPLKLFKNREILVANIVSFLASMILIGLSTYIPLWIQNVLHKGATLSGFILLPMSLAWPFGAMLSSRLIVKWGAKKVSVLGIFIVMLGAIGLTFTSSSMPIWIIACITLMMGLGFGLSLTIFTIVVQSAVAWDLRGAATSSNTFVRTLGQTIGIALFGTYLNHQLKQGGNVNSAFVLSEAIINIYILMAIVAVVSFIFVFWVPARKNEVTE